MTIVRTAGFLFLIVSWCSGEQENKEEEDFLSPPLLCDCHADCPEKSLVYFCGKEERDQWRNPCQDSHYASLPFCDEALAFEDRVRDLLDRIPDYEKLGANRTSTPLSNYATELPSVGVRYSQWWNEALHGVAYSPGVHFDKTILSATSFPQIISISHSFNRTLFGELGKAISTEIRAFYNAGHAGLTYWTPNLNIFRDPRWGRGQETTGEDPYLTSAYVEAYVPGLQYDPSEKNVLKISACCKHYAAYSFENYEGVDRHHFDAKVSPQDMADTYLPAFEACASPHRGGASCMMCSYNSINGVPSCANKELLQQARKNWQFQGYITSDCGATEDIYSNHEYADSPEQAVAQALQAGMDMDCGRWFSKYLDKAVESGVGGLGIKNVDEALYHLFMVHMRLGRFDLPTSFDSITIDQINSPAHQQLAVEAAQQAIVLLKNERSAESTRYTLPYDPSLHSIALVGPHANASRVLLGNYHGHPPYVISPLNALRSYLSNEKVHYAKGCDVDSDSTDGFEEAAMSVNKSDEAIIIVGLDQSQEKEGKDRDQIMLPGKQVEFIEAMLRVANAPVTLVVMSGGAVCLKAYKDDSRIGSIVFAGYPGQAGGVGLVDALFGVYNPSGRLSQTFYSQDYMNEVSFFDMSFRPNSESPGRGYRFYGGDNVVYPFGHGLSYTSFEYKLDVENIVSYGLGDSISVWVNVLVSNTGRYNGADAVLLFLKPPKSADIAAAPSTPSKILRRFEKIYLESMTDKNLSLALYGEDFSLANAEGEMQVVHGEWTAVVGQEELKILV